MKMIKAELVINPGYTTFSHELSRQSYIPTGLDKRGWPKGKHKWRAGNRASVHLDVPQLAWTLMEIQLLTEFEAGRGHRAVVCGFDGVMTKLAGWRIGDTLLVHSNCFFALWTAEEVREDGEGSQKVYTEGSMRPPPRPRRVEPLPEQDGPDAER